LSPTSRSASLSPLLVVSLLALAGCGGHEPSGRPLVVFAAASLEEAMTEVAELHHEETGVEVALNTAGSNVLAQQVRAGAAADVLVSADARWIDDLAAAGLLDPESRRELLTNRLAVIAHPAAGLSLERLEDLGALRFDHLSLADPESVPAGRYARSLLRATPSDGGTVWRDVSGRLVPAPDVRAALALVAADKGAVGIVYRSDVVADRGVELLLEIDREPDPPIRYVGAVVRRPPESVAASERTADGEAGAMGFLDLLSSTAAREIFERHGFLPLD